MNMKRICFLVILLICVCFGYNVSASSINYELRIDENRMFHETVTYSIENNTTNDYLLSIINSPNIYFDINNAFPYKKSVTKDMNLTTVTLKYDYKSGLIQNSKMLNSCFKKISYKEDSYGIIYYGTAPFSCATKADNIAITVISDIKDIINTADIVDGNKYVWNKIDKNFNMDLSLGEYDPESKVLAPVVDDEVTPDDDMDTWPSGDISDYSYVPYLIGGGVGVVALLTISFIALKKRKTNTDDDIYVDTGF